MKRTFYSIIYVVMGLVALASCAGNDDDLGTIQVPGSDYTLPQGKDVAADQNILSLYEKYGSYFLYDFSEKDFQWSQVNTNKVGDDTYRFDPIAPSEVSNLLTAIQKGWLDFYSDDFLKKALPYKVLLTQDVQIKERTFDWSTWDYVFSWVNKPSRHIANQMANWEGMEASQKRAFKSYVQTDFLLYCIEQGMIDIPNEFYAISDYEELPWSATTVDARKAGYVYDQQSNLEWSVDGTVSKSADLNAYISSLVYRTDAEWQDDLQYSYIQRKYDILVEALQKAGIDIKRIGDATFE